MKSPDLVFYKVKVEFTKVSHKFAVRDGHSGNIADPAETVIEKLQKFQITNESLVEAINQTNETLNIAKEND